MIEGLKPYAEYKESGQEWLGNVPAHWRTPRLKTVLREKEARSLDGSGLLLSLSRNRGLIARSDMTDKIHSARTLAGYKLYDPGEIVMNRMQAWSGMFGAGNKPGLVSPDYAVFKLLGDDLVSLLLARLKTPDLVSQFALESRGIGSGFNRLYSDKFGAITISLPPPDEQAAIVRFLDHANRKIDGFIRAKRKLIGLLNEQKQAIIHRAVTRGLHPNVPLKPSGIPWLGDIPKHWEVLPLGRVLVERKENNDPIKTKNILSLSLHDGVVPYAEKTRPGGNKAKDDLTAYKLAYPGDIVVNSMNVVVGSVGLSRYFGAVSPVYYMLRPRQSTDTVEYFDSIFHDVAFQRSLFGLGNGIMVIQSKSSGKLNTIRMRIPMGKLNRVEIPYPPPSEQLAIVAGIGTEIAPVITAIARTEREIALMQEYRTRLTADLVTGKLDVREAAAKLPDLPNETVDTPYEELEENEPEEVEA